MDELIIRAIGELWKLALAILFIVIVFLFKKQIRNLIDRSKKVTVKTGDKEVSVDTTPLEILESKKEEKPFSEEELIFEKKETDIVPKEPKTSDDWSREMLAAFISDDEEKDKKAKKAYEEMQKLESDPLKKLKNEALYFRFRYIFMSDASALNELEKMTQNEDVSDSAHELIGFCYRDVGNFKRALEEFKMSAEKAKTEKERIDRVKLAADCLFRMDKKPEAYLKLTEEIGKASNQHILSSLYEGLASLYELGNNPELQAITLEKALEYRPNDKKLLFNAAYSYSMKGFEALSLLHYKNAEKFSSDDDSVLNNLGVQYERLGMKIKSANAYKKSVKLKGTLAAANLAYIYIYAGLKEEAKRILDRAKNEEDVHPNVGAAISDISKRETGEEELEKKVLDRARKQQRFLLSFAEAYFTPIANHLNFAGKWCFDDGVEIEIIHVGNKIEGNWIREKKKYKFSGEVKNQGAKIITYKMSYDLFNGEEKRFNKLTEGYVYISAEDKQLFIMDIIDDKLSFNTLKKI